MTDRAVLCATAFARATTTSLVGVVSGVFLARVGLAPDRIGVVLACGLAGAAAAALAATFAADRVGRRRFLVLVTLLAAAGTAAFAWSAHPVALGLAAFVGMVNGMGKDRGAALLLEQAA